jgi:signal transduction histidine kinase
MSLRRFLTVGLFFLFVCGCLTAGALWYSTHRSAVIIEKLTDSVASANVAQIVQRNLASHRRRILFENRGNLEDHQKKSEITAQSLIHDSEALTDLITTPAERGYVETVQKRIIAYLMAYDHLRQKGLQSMDLYQSISEQYDETQEAIQNLMQFNLDEANLLQSESAHQYKVNYILVYLAFALLALVLMILLYGLRKFLYLPILKIQKTIEKFELGKNVETQVETGASEIKAIASSFQELSFRLSKQKETQLMFISSVAHDLKNPLGAIKMSTDIIGEDARLSEQSQELLLIVRRQTDHLNRLIGDLLDTTRIESGSLDLNFQFSDLRLLLQDASILHSSLSPIHRIELEIPDEPVMVLCDPHRIAQVFNNLLNNAIKYSPRGGTIKVSLRKDLLDAVVEFTDQGIGIPLKEIDGIFEPFRRSSTSRDMIPGVGLGLSASKKIIKAHEGGDISVSSTVNQGTTFAIRLRSAPGFPHPSKNEIVELAPEL